MVGLIGMVRKAYLVDSIFCSTTHKHKAAGLLKGKQLAMDTRC
jgi:hypothetical protein